MTNERTSIRQYQFPDTLQSLSGSGLAAFELEFRKEIYKEHKDFDEKHWKYPHSFHNHRHIWGVDKTVQLLFANTRNDLEGGKSSHIPEVYDPFVQLDLYNRKVESYAFAHKDWVDLRIRPEELQALFHILFLGHDLGNHSKVQGIGLTVALNGYKSLQAEDRSIHRFRAAIKSTPLLSDTDKQRYLYFLEYATKETQFIPNGTDVIRRNESIPFAALIRAIDVIGQGLVNSDIMMEMVTGLGYEDANQNPALLDVKFDAKAKYSFFWKYMHELFPETMSGSMPGETSEEKMSALITELFGIFPPALPEILNDKSFNTKYKLSEWLGLVSSNKKFAQRLHAPLASSGRNK